MSFDILDKVSHHNGDRRLPLPISGTYCVMILVRSVMAPLSTRCELIPTGMYHLISTRTLLLSSLLSSDDRSHKCSPLKSHTKVNVYVDGRRRSTPSQDQNSSSRVPWGLRPDAHIPHLSAGRGQIPQGLRDGSPELHVLYFPMRLMCRMR